MKAGMVLQPQFSQAFNKILNIPRPVKEMIAWKKFKQEFIEEIKVFEETKMELIKEYSEKDANGEIIFQSGNAQEGGMPKFIETKLSEFNEKMNELFSQDFKCEPKKVKLSDIPETLNFTELEFDLLADFFDLEDTQTK